MKIPLGASRKPVRELWLGPTVVTHGVVMSRFAKTKWLLRWGLVLVLFASLTALFFDRTRIEDFRPCETLRQKLDAALIQPYSATETELNLLEPVALAIGRKKLDKLVEKRSQLDCAIILYRLWRDC